MTVDYNMEIEKDLEKISATGFMSLRWEKWFLRTAQLISKIGAEFKKVFLGG